MTLKLAATVAVLASLALPSIALADVDVTNTPLGQQLLGEAQSYWGTSASCIQYMLLVGPITDQPEGIIDPAAEADTPGCSMRISETAWDSYPMADLCALATHEYGHSLGKEHDTNPTSVMDPGAVYSTGKPADCTDLELAEVAIQQAADEAQSKRESTAEAIMIKDGRRHWAKHHRRRAWRKRSAARNA
jgi:hypothetical protein